MSIALLRFPYLVYDNILKKLSFNEKLSLAVLSKRSRWVVKRSFGKQSFKLRIGSTSYYITTDNGAEISFHSYMNFCGLVRCDTTLKHILIPVQDYGMTPQDAIEKHHDLNRFGTILTQFLIDTFPNLAISMSFINCNENIQSSLKVIRRSNLKIDFLWARCDNQKETHLVLSNCGIVKKLEIEGLVQNQNVILPPLQCDEVIFGGTGCCAQQIVKVFMNCKRFINSHFVRRLSTDGLVLIFEAWKNNSHLEFPELKFHSRTYQNVMRKVHGEPKKFKLGDRFHDCHLLRQVSGIEAVIYVQFKDAEVITLRTDFELVEER